MKAAIGLADLARLFHLLPAEQRTEHAAWLGFRRLSEAGGVERPVGRGEPTGIIERPVGRSEAGGIVERPVGRDKAGGGVDPPARWNEARGGGAPEDHGSGRTMPASRHQFLAEPGMWFWRIEAATDSEPPPSAEPAPQPGLTSADLDSAGCSLSALPPSPPLCPWPTLSSRLRSALHGAVTSREPDVADLVRVWAGGSWVGRIPRLTRRTWAAAATIWIDRSTRLAPFWNDQDAVCLQLERLCGAGALGLRSLDGNLQAVTWARHGDLVGRRRLDPSAPLLVLGDLGCYGSGRDRARWSATARRLRRDGIRVAALVPCSPLDPRWDRDLARAWNAMPWERSAVRNDNLTREERVRRLLRLIAPTFLAQPGLVRALRQLLPAAATEASTEVDAWQHRDVHAADVTGLVLDASASKRLRAEFAELDPALQADVRALIEQWHREMPPELLHAETLAWRSWNQTEAPGDVERAKAFVRKVAVTASTPGGDDGEPGLARDYALHLLGAVRDVIYDQEPALKMLWSVARAHLPGERRPATIAAHEVVTPGGRPEARWWGLHQHGESLIVVPMASAAWSAGRGPGSPVATIVVADPRVWVRRGDEAGPSPMALKEGSSILLQSRERLVLDTDRGCEVTLDVWERAPWAVAAGRDRYGLWAAFEVEGVQQRLRWIPPGRFLMGSPPTEMGRDKDEPQRWVMITKGYWLGETPVTQALWAAVMKSNPSQFVSDDRPVEQVSWDDCGEFIERLNSSLDGFEIRLPTEAEWERACRAGTTAATWVGDHAPYTGGLELIAIAWYGGSHHVGFDVDYGHDPSDGPDRHHPRTWGTHPVGYKQANPYGLYDMLGNVYEWCQDAAKRWGGPHPNVSEPAVDPVPPEPGFLRVYRGGSWYSFASCVRAAHRTVETRGYRFVDLGFRLAGGQVSARNPPAGEPRSGNSGRGAGHDTSRASVWDATTPRRRDAPLRPTQPSKPAKKKGA